ncbi:hypothetical protein RIF29_20411 [Crotalaria pallida]|uniref:Uncharacterized protein n=1 Tax=Crotalaria pallida TaxID=3830 RepID=A0AAN9F1I5_CROPI
MMEEAFDEYATHVVDVIEYIPLAVQGHWQPRYMEWFFEVSHPYILPTSPRVLYEILDFAPTPTPTPTTTPVPARPRHTRDHIRNKQFMKNCGKQDVEDRHEIVRHANVDPDREVDIFQFKRKRHETRHT